MPSLITFGPLRIEYADDTLRPRPWTEQQSSWAHELLEDAPPGPVLELCAGVGHIGLLAVLGTDRGLVCVDSSASACAYARRNVAAAGRDDVAEVRHGAMDTVLMPEERFALVIADPPWVPTDRTARFPEDPLASIDGGADGLDVARTCVEVAARHLLRDGVLLLQLGERQQVDALARELAETAELGVREVRDGAGGVLVLLGRPR
ncbi:methyltransferase [Nocardioides sp. Iso805N]|uniref:methyltransferase n=1 Tax=Nocardioides sp. Iso805N TaxID=1283287 RepID=UPI0003825A42|nr:class I SAM-dependent methyltransferase [Nocardioides sp. Iso805N]